ncbi:hypothetical protein [Streptomyces sp. NPDC051561]|uniref:hypothetical protein n=1 Tax=Streptomyces sp. NPDC051561 TaxID=3365658 RepID=UPI00378DF63B
MTPPPTPPTTRIKLGAWISDLRKRADKLTPKWQAELDTLGMEWTVVKVRRS